MSILVVTTDNCLTITPITCAAQAYKDCVTAVYFSGPTLFAPLITAATNIAAGNNCRCVYTCLRLSTGYLCAHDFPLFASEIAN